MPKETGPLVLSASAVLAGGGEMGARMRAFDWSRTPLGPVNEWPQSLKTTVSTFLTSRFPIFVWWGSDLIQLYNDACASIIGDKHPAGLGRPAHEVWAEIWHIIGPMLKGVMASGEATWSDDQMLPTNRYGYTEEAYFTFAYSPIRVETGGVGAVFCAVVETTARVLGERRNAMLRELGGRTIAESRTAEDACRQAAAVLARHPADVPCALLYLIDETGEVAHLAGSSGLTEDGLASQRCIDLTHTVSGDAGWPLGRVLRTGDPELVEDVGVRFGTPTGGPWTEPPERAMVLPIAGARQDRPWGILVAAFSPRCALDDDYRGFFQLVATQIATAVANARAHEDEKRRADALAELNRAKTTFFSNVSHEFRTPLTLLLGPLEDALNSDTRVLGEEGLALAHRNGLRLLKLVNSLLDFARVEAGRADAWFEPTDLAAYTAELASTFRSAVESAGLSLVVDTPPLPVERGAVHVDRTMWEKIVLNLLSNAFKHTFEGEIAVSIRARGDHVDLVVRDTGIGIPAAELTRVFERFHRLPNTRSRTHEGTGIGLALVQELVRLHGGTISAASQHGAGATFTVTMPFGSAHLPREHVHASTAAGDRRPVSHGAAPFVAEALRWLPDEDEPRHADTVTTGADPVLTESPSPVGSPPAILVVDDNADMRQYMGRLLREQGWFVETAADGDAALDAVRERTASGCAPDLVLTDVMMPGRDGFALLRALRSDVATAAVPVILVSARAGEESRVEGLKAGADDYLVKPFSARELVARVGAHLALSRARARAAAEVMDAHARLAEAHSRLQVEQVRLADVFRKAPTFICVLRGPEHVFEMANDAYHQLVGFRELVGRPVREAIPEATDYFALLDRVLATGESFVGHELPIALQRTPGGPFEQRFVTFVYQPLVEADHSRSGVFVHGVDLTDQVRARSEAERAWGDAEAARQRAEEANAAKAEFLAVMSHELRTPLNAIAGHTQLMELGIHGPLTDLQRDALGRIQRNQQYLLALINDVLNFAKLEAGRVEFASADVSVAEVVADIAGIIEPQMAAKGIACGIQVATELIVRADRDKLQQILLNLLSNAVKFTGRGGQITIDTPVLGERRDAPRHGVGFIRVADTGIGIPRDKQETIFDPFVQLQRKLTAVTEGTGLGLAISRDLARGMGGDVRVRSVAANGSAFTVELPLGSRSPG